MYDEMIAKAGELLEEIKTIESKNSYEIEAEARAVVLKRCLEQAKAERGQVDAAKAAAALTPDQVKK